jgi:hypothetical protein
VRRVRMPPARMTALRSRTKAASRRRRRDCSAHPGSSSSATTTRARQSCVLGSARTLTRYGRPSTEKRPPSSRRSGPTRFRLSSRRARSISSGAFAGTTRRLVSGCSARESAGESRETRRPCSSQRRIRLGRARSCSSHTIRSIVSRRRPRRSTPANFPEGSRRVRSTVKTTRRWPSPRWASASRRVRSLHRVRPPPTCGREAGVKKVSCWVGSGI